MNKVTKHIDHRDQEKQVEYLSRQTGVGRAGYKSFANVLVAKKMIYKGSERYSRQGFSHLHCSRVLFIFDDSVLDE